MLEETSFLYGANSDFIEELYTRYLRDPQSVDPSWQNFFAGLGEDMPAVLDEMRGATWAPRMPACTPEAGAEDKIEAMKSAGIAVADSPASLGSTMLKVLKG